MNESEMTAIALLILGIMNAVSIYCVWKLEVAVNNNADVLEAVRKQVWDMSNDLDIIVKSLSVLEGQQKALDDSMNGLAFNGGVLVTSGDEVRIVKD